MATASTGIDVVTIFDVINFISSVVALTLAIFAIWLSVVFYRQSEAASKATQEAAKGIAASVERLEKIFDKLYSDTFSMMRDTVSDVRKHIWRSPESEKQSEEKLKEELSKKIRTVVEQKEGPGRIPDEIMSELPGILAGFLKRGDRRSVKVKRARVLDVVRALKNPTVARIASEMGMEEEDIAIPLFAMRESGDVTWKGPKNTLSSDTLILTAERPSGDRKVDEDEDDDHDERPPPEQKG